MVGGGEVAGGFGADGVEEGGVESSSSGEVVELVAFDSDGGGAGDGGADGGELEIVVGGVSGCAEVEGAGELSERGAGGGVIGDGKVDGGAGLEVEEGVGADDAVALAAGFEGDGAAFSCGVEGLGGGVEGGAGEQGQAAVCLEVDGAAALPGGVDGAGDGDVSGVGGETVDRCDRVTVQQHVCLADAVVAEAGKSAGI